MLEACKPNTKSFSQLADELGSDLEAWFAVSGDMDDFIYYGDTDKPHSEK